MRLPRFRLRTLMVCVAVVAMALGAGCELFRRRDLYRRQAALHRERMLYLLFLRSGVVEKNVRLAEWHEAMVEKYRLAARRPWLPIALDSLPPK